MKTIACIIAAAFGISLASAQNDTTAVKPGVIIIEQEGNVSDTTRIELGNSYITIVKKADNEYNTEDEDDSDRDNKMHLTWWNGIDFGVNGIMGDNYKTDLPDGLGFMEPDYGKSRYIAFNFGQMKARIVSDYVGFTTGFGVQFYGFKYSGDNSLVLSEDTLYSVPTEGRNVTKSKLRATYFVIPALLEFNTSLDPDKALHITAGVVGKVRLENMYKEKYSTEGDNYKQSIKGDLGLNLWQADAIVKVGFKKFSLFTQVGLIPLFDSKNAVDEDLYTFAAGISLSFNDW